MVRSNDQGLIPPKFLTLDDQKASYCSILGIQCRPERLTTNLDCSPKTSLEFGLKGKHWLALAGPHRGYPSDYGLQSWSMVRQQIMFEAI